MRQLIINADDFGMSIIFNEVILELIEAGQILSTTVMVRRITESQQSQIEHLIKISKQYQISIGLHLEFSGSDYLNQIEKQVLTFEQWFGFFPSHLDIHKASHFKDSIAVVADYCHIKNIPCRNHGIKFEGVRSPEATCFFGSINNFSEIEGWLTNLPENGVFEILFHPGKFDPDCKSSLNKSREQDALHIRTLNSKRGHEFKLSSFFVL